MLNKNTKNPILILLLALAILFTGCASETQAATVLSGSVAGTVTEVEEQKTVTAESEDSDATYSAQDATTLTLKDNGTASSGSGVTAEGNIITINRGGTYLIQGSLTAGQLIVDVDKEEKVHMIFNGVQIASSSGPAIWIKSAEKVILTLAEGTENQVQDSVSYVLTEGEDEPDAAIFSKEDLSINGSGKLAIIGNYANGVKSKDTMLILGGILEVNAVGHAISGKDGVGVFGGTLTLNAGEDGVHSSGEVLVKEGLLNIAAGDDGIHGDASLTIDGGSIAISKSYEGLESANITVNGGVMDLVAKDDGFNAAGGNDGSGLEGQSGAESFSAESDYFIRINGGTVHVNADGDGIDANGSLYFTGGAVLVSGPTGNGNGALDYDGECLVTGGVLAIAGSSGMAQAPGENSTQNAIQVIFTEMQEAGALVSLVDSSGKAVLTFAPEKKYQSVVISSPQLTTGETYTLVSGGTSSAPLSEGYALAGVISNGNDLTQITVSNSITRITDRGEAVTGSMGGGPRPEGRGMKPPL